MTHTDAEKSGRKEAMKRLRQSRKEMIKAASARMKAQKKAIKAIKEQLEDGPKTVPEIAEAIGMEPSEVFWFVAALKKYGEVSEAEKSAGYFQYGLIHSQPEETLQ